MFDRTNLTQAIFAIWQAVGVCRRIQAELLPSGVAYKADRSPVTIADYCAQAVICYTLSRAYPGIPVVAEETSGELRRQDRTLLLQQVTRYVQTVLPEATPFQVCDWIELGNAQPAVRFWTLDPIDGTIGFLRGGQYAIALALIEDAHVQLGVLACPNLSPFSQAADGVPGVLFVAERGRGAVMAPLATHEADTLCLGGLEPRLVPITVSQQSDISIAQLVESVEAAHTDHSAHRRLAQALGIRQPMLRMDSQAKYGLVACGRADAYLRLPAPNAPQYQECLWDHAAGALLVEEAGGRVSDIWGASLDFGQGRQLSGNRGVVASNGRLHDLVLDALRTCGVA